MKIKKLPDIDLSKVQTPTDYYREQRELEIHEEFQRYIKHTIRETLGDERYWED